ncbi:hypothetical protein BD414DRAFT_468867 [Trametes punicea]|nr:hypothetical protein BD414DRAFT_468867 [Trametes punicea]
MSLGSPLGDLYQTLFWLAAFWLSLYGYRYHRCRTRRISTLPSLTSSSSSAASTELFRSTTTRITLKTCHLRYQSTAWNTLHQSSSARLAKRSDWRRTLQLVYDAGSALGIAGMLASVFLIFWTTVHLSSTLYFRLSNSSFTANNGNLSKRDMDNEVASNHEAHAVPPLHLIVPGVTMPLHHLPLLLIALLTTQVIHECGHAVAAALDSVPLASAGLGLTVILPSAFVAFPSEETDSLPRRSRVRLISAGAFHNLMLWLAFGVAASIRTHELVWPILGYHDVSAYGRAVVKVDESSPLRGHLPVGAVIYKVGDETLAAKGGAAGRWESLMSAHPDNSGAALGWCADQSWFSAQDGACCASRRGLVASSSCFTAIGELTLERCIDPLRVLQPKEGETMRRCGSASDCGHGGLCIKPRGDQELVSLTLHLPPWLRSYERDSERTLIWQGTRAEILSEVEVGDWLPSCTWLPMGLPVLWGTFYFYLKTLSLSLYFFNLLPLPHLDGGQLFNILHDAWTSRANQRHESIPIQQLEQGEDNTPATSSRMPIKGHADRKAQYRMAVYMIIGGLLGLCTILSLVNTYL